jgi:3-oxo-5alpha-steroid 4-dehydrogenase
MLWGAPVLLNVILGGTKRGRRIADLARACRIDADALQRTVDHFNSAVNEGRADPLGKIPELLQPVQGRAYYAVNLSLDNKYAPLPALTLGGLVVDEDTGGVKRADGSVIPGLYAAGRTAVGLPSKGYVSGLSIADTVFSGRRAGHAAAQAAIP